MFLASFQISRQTGWDLWLAVCVAAALVLISYAWFGQLWRSARGWVALLIIAFIVIGTVLIAAIPALHIALLGLVWTFIVLLALSLAFYLNLLGQLGVTRMVILLCMRGIALALLVLMLFGPIFSYITRAPPTRPLLVLIDTSGSMSFPDVQNGPTRLQSVWMTLKPLLPRIDEHFVPKFFTFAEGWKELKSPDELGTMQADGKSTDITQGLSHTMNFATAKDAAVVLISDGIDNTSPDVMAGLADAPAPIHAVLVGSEQAEPSTMINIAVDSVDAPDDFVVGHETKIKANIKSVALANRVVDVKLAEVDDDGKPVTPATAQKLVLQSGSQGQTVELPYKPAKVGVRRLAVWVDPIPGERSTIDNRQEFQGLALDPRIKVLYVEGRLRPEYGPLRLILRGDPNVELATLLHVAADKFSADGRVDGEPFKALPTTPEGWKKFDVIILGDIDANFLTRTQQSQIEQRVFTGGGLLMIGGQNNFGAGGYEGTDIEKALAVFCGPRAEAQEMSSFVPRLTPEGIVHPAMQGLQDWFGTDQKKPTHDLPPLRGNVVVPKPKSGAEVLLVHPDRPGPDGNPQIVLAVEQYGSGRSAAFTADTTYLWNLPLRGMGQDSPYNRLWAQLVRWLAGADVRNRQRGAGVEGLLNKSVYQLGEKVHVRAMVRDEHGDATNYAEVNLTLAKSGQVAGSQIPLARVGSRQGLYEVTLDSPGTGEYMARVVATKDGKELGRQDLKFIVMQPAEEMFKLAANPKLMQDLANLPRHPGSFRRLDQLPALIDDLLRNDPTANAAQERVIPLDDVVRAGMTWLSGDPGWPRKYDMPVQGALAFSILALEWLLRRLWQLP